MTLVYMYTCFLLYIEIECICCSTCHILLTACQQHRAFKCMHVLYIYIHTPLKPSQISVNYKVVISFPLSPQNGDSAAIMATINQRSNVLRVLVDAGSDLNVQNEVRYTVTVASATGVIPSCQY